MSIHAQPAIRAILESRLAAWAAARAPALPVLWENVRTDAEPQGEHLRAYVIPATPQNPYLGSDVVLHRGLFQVSVFCLAGTGSNRAETLAGEIAALFPVDAVLADGAQELRVIAPPALLPAQPDDSWYRLAVRVTYQCAAPAD